MPGLKGKSGPPDNMRRLWGHPLAGLLRYNPEAVDLRVEDDGARKGMWSVTQPQWVITLRRTR